MAWALAKNNGSWVKTLQVVTVEYKSWFLLNLFEWLLWMINKRFENTVPQDLTGRIFYAPRFEKVRKRGGREYKISHKLLEGICVTHQNVRI